MNKISYRNILVILGAVVLVLGVLFFAGAISSEPDADTAAVYSSDWYYLQGNEKISIPFPADIELTKDTSFTIYNDRIAADAVGNYVYVNNAIYRPEMYLDDTLLYRYDDGGLRRNPPELSYQICKAKIGDDVTAGTFKITYHQSDTSMISLPEVRVGSADSIIKALFFTNAYTSVITITMITLGILVLLVGIITFRQDYTNKRKLLLLGAFLVLMGIWCTTDSPLVQYLLDYSNINMNLDFFVFMFLILPFVGYIKNITGMDKYKSLQFIIIAVFLNSLIQMILVLLNVFTLLQMVPVTHLLIVISVVVSVVLLCREYQKNKVREVLLCLRAFAIFGGTSVISILIYFLKSELFYQNLLQTGLLVFILILMWNIVTEFITSLQYKAEAKAYKKLAEVDKLTNLSNRRSFDSKISEIERNTEQYENVLLIFIDVNGLKWINDSFGHTKGDEAIIAAADCIKKSYQKQGFCYRIGGDEFCVIIENPLVSGQDAIRLIENEVKRYNKTFANEFQLTVAVGCSFIKENGSTKSIATWKEEADINMYEDKKEKKFEGKRIL